MSARWSRMRARWLRTGGLTNGRAPAVGDGPTTVGIDVPGASPDDIGGQSLNDSPEDPGAR